MSDIQRLIELLKSDNPNKRYDACEELRVSQPPLPQEAIDALRAAAMDPNADVADAAQRALSLHAELAALPELPPAAPLAPIKPSWSLALVGGIIPLAIFSVAVVPVLLWEGFQASWICIFPLGLGVVGAYLGQVIILAILHEHADKGLVFMSALAGGVIMGIIPILIF